MKYTIECYTKAGWQDIRTVGDMIYIAPPDIEIEHQSNPLFEWELKLTEKGLRIPGGDESSIRICPPLQTGRYRFVYWGLIGSDPLAVAFDLSRTN
jgi:hypothetical protein